MKLRLQHVLMASLCLLALSCSKEPAEPAVVPEAQNVPAIENEVRTLVNAHRLTLGLSPLDFSPVAYEYANAHTDYMIATGSLNHHNFSARASGIAAEVDAKAVSENVGRDYPSAAKALEGWLGSESHRKTMEGDFSHTAVSVKKDAQGNLYYTQLFYLE